MSNYKWKTPKDWLRDKLDEAGEDMLYVYAVEMAEALDNDQIQDLFQTDMDNDGYFEKEEV